MLRKGGDGLMATENFLINPPHKIGRRRKRNPIGEMLVTVGANPKKGNPMKRRKSNPDNPWYGDSSGHRIAALMRWGKIRKGTVNKHRKRAKVHRVAHRKHVVRRRVVKHKRGRWAPKHIRMRRKIAQQSFWTSKYGHMLAHPRSKKVFTRKGLIMRKRRKSNSWFDQPVRHRKAAKKGWRRGHKLSGKRVRHYNAPRRRRRNPEMSATHTNPRRRHHRASRYRNPFGLSVGKLTSSFTNVRSWAPLAVTGGLSAITGAVVPTMIGIANPWAKLGAQLVVAIGGGLVVEKFVDARHGQAWMVVGVSMVGYQLLKQFVLVPYAPQFAVGLGDYNDYYAGTDDDEVSQQIGAYPQEVGAFPSAMNAYPGVGADDMVGAYPYDGSPY